MRTVAKIVMVLTAFVVSYMPASASAQITLPYFEGFENTMGGTFQDFVPALPGAPDFSYGNTIANEGRLRLDAGAGFVNNGTFAATMDRSAPGAVNINFLLGQLDMSNYNANNDTVLMSFSFATHDDEASPNDRAWIRGSTSDTFIEIADLNQLEGPPGTYVNVTDVNISAILLANGQNFSATFQMRFGQEDNFPATSPTGSDGYSFDDISLTLAQPDDMGATAVLAPSNNECGLSMTDVIVEVTNFGGSPQTNVPVVVNVTGAVTATLNATLAGPIAFGETQQLVAGQIDAFSGGQITVDAATQLMGDMDPANDNVNAVIDISATEVPLGAAAVGCPAEAAVLSVMAEPNTDYTWWDAPTGGTELAQGPTFNTPPVMGMTTYYVQRVSAPIAVGPMDNTFGGGGDYGVLTAGLVFDANSDIVIDTVYVYPGSAGDVTVNVFDANDVLLDTATVPVVAGDVGMKTALAVDLQVPAGLGHYIDAAGSTVTGLYRNNSGAAMPYASAGGEVIITNTINNLGGYYYFFYDWEVSPAVCDGERTPVIVDADETACQADLSVSKAGPATANAGEEVQYTITVTNNGPSGAYSVQLDDPGAAGLTFVSNSGDCTTAFPCDLGYLPAGASAVVDAVFTIEPSFAGTLTNTATATTTASETMPGDESGSADVDVAGAADLVVTMSGSPDPVLQGSTLTYTVTVTNNGPSDATGVAVDTTLPAEVTFGSTTGCDSDPSGVPTCGLGTIAAGASAEFTITGDVADDFLGTITASASASSATAEANPGDETGSVDVTVTDQTGGAGGGGGGGGGQVVDGGCGCRQAGGSSSGYGWLSLLGLAAIGLRRRRRRAA